MHLQNLENCWTLWLSEKIMQDSMWRQMGAGMTTSAWPFFDVHVINPCMISTKEPALPTSLYNYQKHVREIGEINIKESNMVPSLPGAFLHGRNGKDWGNFYRGTATMIADKKKQGCGQILIWLKCWLNFPLFRVLNHVPQKDKINKCLHQSRECSPTLGDEGEQDRLWFLISLHFITTQISVYI